MLRKKGFRKWMRGVALFAVTAVLATSIDMTAYATSSEIATVATEQTEWKFDFGPASAPLQDGWTSIAKSTVYSDDIGYGWTTAPDDEYNEKDSAISSVVLPEGLTDKWNVARDFVRMKAKTAYQFVVNVPSGEYEVELYGGMTGSRSLAYTVEGIELETQTVSVFTCIATNVTVEDGQLTLDLRAGDVTEIRGLVITKKQTVVESLSAPANLTATPGTETDEGVEVIFGFDTVTGAVSYNLYQSVDGETRLLQKLTSNSQVVTVDPDTKYIFTVTAVDQYGMESPLSDSLVLDLTGGQTQTEWYFDFGTSSSDVQDNWTKMEASDAYSFSDIVGYGWKTVPNGGGYASNNLSVTLADEYQSLVKVADDRVRGSNAWEFAVKVPNGHYEVTIYGGYPSEKDRYDLSYATEGNVMEMSVYNFDSVTKEVTVEDGELNLQKNGEKTVEIRGLAIKQTLATPTSVEATADTASLAETVVKADVTFTFKGVEAAKTYNIYQSCSVGDGKMKLLDTFVAGTDPNKEQYIAEVVRGATYKYYITAVTEEGKESVASNLVELDLVAIGGNAPAVPQKPEVTNSETANMQLAWEPVEGALLYNVYRSQQGEDYELVGIVDGTTNATTYTFTDMDEDVTENIPWYYKVQAQNVYGVSDCSDAAVTEIGDALMAEVGTWHDRALVAINLAGSDGAEVSVSATDKDGNEYTSGVYLSWRSYEEDFEADGKTLKTTFDIYRNGTPIATGLKVTNLIDEGGTANDTYKVVGSNDNAEETKEAFGENGLAATEVSVWENQYLELQLVKPEEQTMPDGTVSDYVPNDTMLADLDGDGDQDLVVKWRPRNFKDNGFSGYTATTFYDGYDVNFSTGEVKLLWRIDMGVNIRSGSHYEVVQVWDYNSDGISEIALRTADGTVVYKPVYEGNQVTGFEELERVSCCGKDELPVSNTNAAHDYRETGDYYGHVTSGPEYFTMFSGRDGSIIDTIDYEPELGDISSWGDSYGNRAFRFLAGTAYLDGVTPHYIQCRGYYERTALAAYKLVPDTDGNGKEDIQRVWLFDTEMYNGEFEGQGNHGLAIADVDADGKDEIVYGGLLVDHDGTPVYTTELDHGDAMHVTDLVLWNDGLEVMSVHEHAAVYYAAEVRDAASGKILMGMHIPGGIDLGRGVADDIDPTSPGGEWWTVISPDYDASNGEPSVASKQGSVLSTESRGEDLIILANHASPAANALIYWDGDLLREIQDKEWNFTDGVPVSVQIGKWNYIDNKEEYILDSTEIWAHGTKGNMGIVADFLGDWREELITMCSFGNFLDNTNGVDKIRVYATTIQTEYVIPCLMEDLQYLESLAWQNTGYNQPAHLSYMLSEGTITAQITQKELLHDKVTFDFTEANDGTKWGHPVTGYEIWRADMDDDGKVGSYKKVATLGNDTLTYTDTSIEEGKGYAYTVAAVVDGKTSYHSEPLKVVIPRKIQEILPIELEALVEGNDPEAALPGTVTILGTDGVKEQAKVTWDLTGFDNNKLGEQTIVANVNGWDTPLNVTWEVVARVIKSFNEIEIIKVVTGQTPTLPTQVDVVYNDGDEETVSVTWDISDLDVNTVATYEIKGSVAEPVENAGLVPVVTVRVANDYVVKAKDSYVEVEIGETFEMPAKVEVEYVSGKTATLDVVWNLEGISTENAKTFEVTGITDTDFEVVGHVSVVYPAVKRFDFGADSSNTVEGWIEVLGGTKTDKTVEEMDIHYTKERGYGFTNLALTANARPAQDYTQDGVLPKEIYQDMAICGGQTFVVDIPNGTYVVDLISGSTDANTLRGTAEGISFSVSSAARAYAIASVEVEVEDGQLTIIISDGTVRMNGIIIREVELAAEESPNPEVTPEPEVTPSPEGTPSPEVTPEPEVTPSPEVSPKPEVTPSPEVSPNPEKTPTPTPEGTPTPSIDTVLGDDSDAEEDVDSKPVTKPNIQPGIEVFTNLYPGISSGTKENTKSEENKDTEEDKNVEEHPAVQVVYTIKEAASKDGNENTNIVWIQNTTEGLTVSSNADFEKFVGVKVDGIEVDSANYTAKSGSTIVTLKPEYLATLAIGEHDLSIISTDGQADAIFMVDAKVEEKEVGETVGKNTSEIEEVSSADGEFSWIMLIPIITVIIVGMVLIMAYLRKRKLDSEM